MGKDEPKAKLDTKGLDLSKVLALIQTLIQLFGKAAKPATVNPEQVKQLKELGLTNESISSLKARGMDYNKIIDFIQLLIKALVDSGLLGVKSETVPEE